MAKQDFDLDVFLAMQDKAPIASYRKTILGKVSVIVLDMFSKQPREILLHGQPNDPRTFVDLYSVPEDVFFKRQNRRLFEQGVLIAVPVEKKVETPVAIEEDVPLEQASDETLRQLVNSRYKALEAALTKTTSEALVYRILNLAREEEKSEKIIKAIESRLAEIQNVRFNTEE